MMKQNRSVVGKDEEGLSGTEKKRVKIKMMQWNLANKDHGDDDDTEKMKQHR